MLKKELLPDQELHVAEYKKAADTIGYRTEFILDEQVACFLRAYGHGVYPYEAVAKYLGRQAGFFRGSYHSRRVWYWYPLREKDREDDCSFGLDRDGLRGRPMGSPLGYDKPVPLPVLMTVRDLEQAWRDHTNRLRFFVSDFANVRHDPDPFLAVTAGIGRRLFVIERWDEPSFRG